MTSGLWRTWRMLCALCVASVIRVSAETSKLNERFQLRLNTHKSSKFSQVMNDAAERKTNHRWYRQRVNTCFKQRSPFANISVASYDSNPPEYVFDCSLLILCSKWKQITKKITAPLNLTTSPHRVHSQLRGSRM